MAVIARRRIPTRFTYTDDVIGILPERNLNNGPPSIHAALIAAAAAPQLGEQVVHLGAGVGYYTAILAELIGATGEGDDDRVPCRAPPPALRRRLDVGRFEHDARAIAVRRADMRRLRKIRRIFAAASAGRYPRTRLPRRGRAADDPG